VYFCTLCPSIGPKERSRQALDRLPLVSNFLTNFWIQHFDGARLSPNSVRNAVWHALNEPVCQYLRKRNPRYSAVYIDNSLGPLARDSSCIYICMCVCVCVCVCMYVECIYFVWFAQWVQILLKYRRWLKTTLFGHISLSNCLIKDVAQGKIKGTKRGGRRSKQLLGDLREKKKHFDLKVEALDCSPCRTRFGRDYGPAATQSRPWMNFTR